jgi:hypothetical protein
MTIQGIEVFCQTCKRRKKPHGRDSRNSDLCDERCKGYNEWPKPGCLWPRETSKQFGFEHCDNAVEEIEGGDDVCDSCGEKAKLSRGECMICVLNRD